MSVVSSQGVKQSRWRAIDDNKLEKLSSRFFSVDGAPFGQSPMVDVRTGHAVWSESRLEDGDISAFGFLAPASADRLSEDAPPLFASRAIRHSQQVVLGIFDGMGGAGAQVISGGTGPEVTQAYLASRLARRSIEESIWGGGELLLSRQETFGKLSKDFIEFGSEIKDMGTSRMRGSMVKSIPTTMVLAMCERIDFDKWDVRVQWTGDSRAYLLGPRAGLQQVTRDDVECEDPLEQLQSDLTLRNVINGSTSFAINEKRFVTQGPALLLLASDGLFHYLPTPGALEDLVLRSLADTEMAMARRLGELAVRQSRDDVSFAGLALGSFRPSEMKMLFRTRLQVVAGRGYGQLQSVDLDEGLRAQLVNRLWQEERESYMDLIR